MAGRSIQGRVLIGISGWTYKPWRGAFYPEKLRQKDELAYAGRQFPTIEINGTFYALQRPKSYRSWAEQTPEHFVFAVKATRFITHVKRLKEVRKPLANFFASGLLALGRKLGPILWQLPPNHRFDPERLETFLSLLPADTEAAGRLSREHDAFPADRICTEPVADMPIRHALEVRHRSFETPEFIALLRRHNVAAVVADSVAWPCIADVTADFVYLRLHGSQELYVSGYDSKALDRWAKRIRAWRVGGEAADMHRIGGPPSDRRRRDVYVYFDNDAKVRAPADARSLIAKLGIGPSED